MRIKNLSREDRFVLFFLATILSIRAVLLVLELMLGAPSPTRIHHYMYGSVLIVIAPLFRSIPLYGIGWGLLVDDLMLFPTSAESWGNYFSATFILGTIIIAAFVVFFRKQFVSIFR